MGAYCVLGFRGTKIDSIDVVFAFGGGGVSASFTVIILRRLLLLHSHFVCDFCQVLGKLLSVFPAVLKSTHIRAS